MADSLVATKLMPPWAHRPAVPRPQLVARLRAGLDGPFTLLCAPAGFGKTSLALQALDGYAAVAWLSLEPDDGEPTRFAHYLLAALARAAPDLAPALDPLRASSPLDLRATMATLVNLLSTYDTPLVLVLEDYHALDAPEVDAALSWLLAHQPLALHLLLTSREDPQLPLARLRARGQLAELRGADLRFSTAEGAALVHQITGRALSEMQATTLIARTEGWAAGLQLASLALRESADVDSLIASLCGTHRFILDYLTEEVLLAQPPALQQFLLHTSLLDRLCGELCDAVMRAEGAKPQPSALSPQPSAIVLAEIERQNLFLVPLDAERRWYRYHALFADLLRARLAATAGDMIAGLHRRAAAWYAAAITTQGMALLTPAMHHALEGGDHELAADLIEAHGAALNGRGEQALLRRWLTLLPGEIFAQRPQLCLRHAWLLTLTGQHDAAAARLRDAEHACAALPAGAPAGADRAALISGNAAAIRAYLTFARGDVAATIAHSQTALGLLPATSTVVRTSAHLMIGLGALEGDQSALAEQQLRQAVACGQAGGNPYAAVTAQGLLGTLLLRQGRLDAAEQFLHTALDSQRDPNGAPFPFAGDLAVRLGQVRYERNDLVSATALLEQGLRCGELVANGWTVEAASLALAWLRAMQGGVTAAHAPLDSLEALAPRLEHIVERGLIRALRARIQLAAGDLPTVQTWLEAEESRPSVAHRVAYLPIALMRIRALIALRRSSEATALIAPLLAAAEAAGRAGQQIQLQVLRALALQAAGNLTGAAAALQPALELGAARGHVRSFLDEGPGVAALLQRMKDEGGRMRPHIARLLGAFAGREAVVSGPELHPSSLILHPLPELLTSRELELLQLIDAGLSNQAIAERLVLTIGTVKWHLTNLYAKLAVRGRTEALARARSLNLLS